MEDISLFSGATDTPVCNGILRFTSGMAAEPFK